MNGFWPPSDCLDAGLFRPCRAAHARSPGSRGSDLHRPIAHRNERTRFHALPRARLTAAARLDRRDHPVSPGRLAARCPPRRPSVGQRDAWTRLDAATDRPGHRDELPSPQHVRCVPLYEVRSSGGAACRRGVDRFPRSGPRPVLPAPTPLSHWAPDCRSLAERWSLRWTPRRSIRISVSRWSCWMGRPSWESHGRSRKDAIGRIRQERIRPLVAKLTREP